MIIEASGQYRYGIFMDDIKAILFPVFPGQVFILFPTFCSNFKYIVWII